MEESYGSESSKYSSRHQELDAETGSSRHSSGKSGSSKYSVTYNPEIHKGWGNNNNFEIHPVVFDESESSKRSEVIQEDMDGIEGEKMRLSMSSSSSSGSSADDQFQEDIKPSKSRSGSTSKSQVSSVTHESTSTQSPPIQVMDRLGEFDPYRIPSAVFARSKLTTPMDWSIASNESLFSIQVGNNSFSRDHFPNLKSGELFKSGEFMGLSPSPVALAVDANKKFVNIDKREATVVSDDAVKDKTGTTTEEPIEEKPTHPVVSWNSSTISNHSDDNGTSGRSFAFPVRKKKNKKKKKKQKKCAWSSCYCSDCSWAFCHRTRPGCYCSNYCWNCSIKRWCCHLFTTSEDGRNVSKKDKAEQQQQQEQPLASAVPSKSACCNCRSCFPSCRWQWHWHRCCCCCCCCNCCRRNCC